MLALSFMVLIGSMFFFLDMFVHVSGILLNTLPPVLCLILESLNCLAIFCLLSFRYTGKIFTNACDISYVANTFLLLNLLLGIG